jgi:hypothetical protein
MNPTNPSPAQAVDIWVKVGYNAQTNHGFIYYTTDGTNPEGAFGVGKGSTMVVAANWADHDNSDTTIDWFKGTIPGSNQVSGATIRYKIALYQDNIPTISDSDAAKLYGLTQFGVTNFDPTAVTVWLHNDWNTNSTVTGLQTGFHMVRARSFLPRTGKSGVFNTFLQTFYYDGQLPGGVIAFPAADGNSINNNTYQVVVRADSNVTGVDFNIQDSDSSNDDAATGQPNGNGSTNSQPVFVSASPVTPDATISQQYTNYPQEFRFNYVAVPGSGTATITVRLKTVVTSVYPNRLTTLTRTVNTLGPANTLYFSNPASDGMAIVQNSNAVYLVQACFTPSLDTNNVNLFSLYINGDLQPRSSYLLRPPGSVPGCPGLRSFLYNWTNAPAGSNILQLAFTNQVSLTTARSVVVGIIGSPQDSDGDGMPDWKELVAGTNPYDSNSVLRITAIQNGNQLVWSSVSNFNYQVLATTNIDVPMSVISPVIHASNSLTFWTDTAPDPDRKFYRVQVVP